MKDPFFLLHVIVIVLLLSAISPSCSFFAPSFSSRRYELNAKPKRLEENADGLLYVNDKVSLKDVLGY
jgi:hypothetical protein